MSEQVEAGQMVFVADGGVGVGAVREVRGDGLVINIQNAGDVVIPHHAVAEVHSGKVMLDLERLDPSIVERLRHVHDAEYPRYAVVDRTDGTPDGARPRP